MEETVKKDWERSIPKFVSLDAESQAYVLIAGSIITRLRYEGYQAMLNSANEIFKRWEWNAHGNNWFKMHGYPMRRKGSKKS